MNSVKDKIYKLRKRQGLSQEELGFEIDVSRQTISKWELGTSEPDLKNLQALSRFFKVDLNYFLSDEIAIEDATALATQDIVKEKPKAKKLYQLKVALVVAILLLVVSLGAVIYLIIRDITSISAEPEDEVYGVVSVYYPNILLIALSIIATLLILGIIFLIIVIKRVKRKENDKEIIK